MSNQKKRGDLRIWIILGFMLFSEESFNIISDIIGEGDSVEDTVIVYIITALVVVGISYLGMLKFGGSVFGNLLSKITEKLGINGSNVRRGGADKIESYDQEDSYSDDQGRSLNSLSGRNEKVNSTMRSTVGPSSYQKTIGGDGVDPMSL